MALGHSGLPSVWRRKDSPGSLWDAVSGAGHFSVELTQAVITVLHVLASSSAFQEKPLCLRHKP